MVLQGFKRQPADQRQKFPGDRASRSTKAALLQAS
jgi:hypothetical protein